LISGDRGEWRWEDPCWGFSLKGFDTASDKKCAADVFVLMAGKIESHISAMKTETFCQQRMHFYALEGSFLNFLGARIKTLSNLDTAPCVPR
jgi:hypothetical protein